MNIHMSGCVGPYDENHIVSRKFKYHPLLIIGISYNNRNIKNYYNLMLYFNEYYCT